MSELATQSRSRQHAAKDSPWQPLPDSGLRELGIAVFWAVVLAAPFLGIGARISYNTWREKEDVRLAAIEAAQAYERLVAAPAKSTLDVTAAAHGRDLFMSACITCHGPNGTGMPGLGLNLVESDFVAGTDDAGMQHFLVTGRPTALPVAMPARGGRDDLTDDDLRDIVTFVRGLQDPRRMPELPAMVVAKAVPTDADKSLALAAAGGDAELAGYIASGAAIFSKTCIACHGAGGVGIKGNGKALAMNEFIQSQDEDALFDFITRGRDPGDPKNTTGVAMPPKGGNPALSEDDLLDVISYLRTLQGKSPGAVSTGK